MISLPELVVKNILAWISLTFFSLIVNLLAFPLAPVIAFISLNNEVPSVFNWWMTPDNEIDGDEGHRARWPDNSTNWDRLKRRVAWLWRNRSYGFDYDVCGRVIGDNLTTYGDVLVSDRTPVSGYLFQWDEKGTWAFYLVKPYSFKKDRCIRIRLGWKIDNTRIGYHDKNMMATSVSITKKYGK